MNVFQENAQVFHVFHHVFQGKRGRLATSFRILGSTGSTRFCIGSTTGSTGAIHFSIDSLAWVAAVLCVATGSIHFSNGFASQGLLTKELCRQQRARTRRGETKA